MEILAELGTEEQIKKYVLSVVIIQMSKDDWVSAKSYLDKMKLKFDADRGGFSRIDDFLQAFDEKDDDKMKNIIKTYLVFAVDNELLKMVNNIVKSEEWIRETQAIQEQNSKKHISNTTDSYHTKAKILDTSIPITTVDTSNDIPSQEPKAETQDDEEDEEFDLR